MRKTKLIFFIIPLIILSGCYKEIDIELEEGDVKLIIESWFTTEEKVHEIKLSQSTSYFDDQDVPKVSGAEVQITGGGETFVFSESEPGIYLSAPTANAQLNTSYTLSVNFEGQTYSATDYCDTVPTLDQMQLYPSFDVSGNLVGYDILVWTTELSGHGHYYAWKVLVNGNYISDVLTNLEFESDEYLGDGLYFEAWPMEYIESTNTGDTVRLEQHNISKQTYDAFIAVLTETEWKGGIFDAPPANIPSNFNNGAFGMFVVSSLHSMEAIIP